MELFIHHTNTKHRLLFGARIKLKFKFIIFHKRLNENIFFSFIFLVKTYFCKKVHCSSLKKYVSRSFFEKVLTDFNGDVEKKNIIIKA